MQWQQFFTPVDSIDSRQARAMLDRQPGLAITILDVRQPAEYRAGHLPGARLIPLPQLAARLSELDPQKPVLAYCALGGRGRLAAQILTGRGFKKVYNLAGGLKAWNGPAAMGREDQGLALFAGSEAPERLLIVAYSLEQGLRDFYLTMAEKVRAPEAASLFRQLADIELRHQDRIFREYARLSDSEHSRRQFEAAIVVKAAEGGLTTEEYTDLFRPDRESPCDIVAVAMSIEAQALDLYLRVADRVPDPVAQSLLGKIAAEETAHLQALGELLERLCPRPADNRRP